MTLTFRKQELQRIYKVDKMVMRYYRISLYEFMSRYGYDKLLLGIIRVITDDAYYMEKDGLTVEIDGEIEERYNEVSLAYQGMYDSRGTEERVISLGVSWVIEDVLVHRSSGCFILTGCDSSRDLLSRPITNVPDIRYVGLGDSYYVEVCSDFNGFMLRNKRYDIRKMKYYKLMDLELIERSRVILLFVDVDNLGYISASMRGLIRRINKEGRSDLIDKYKVNTVCYEFEDSVSIEPLDNLFERLRGLRGARISDNNGTYKVEREENVNREVRECEEGKLEDSRENSDKLGKVSVDGENLFGVCGDLGIERDEMGTNSLSSSVSVAYNSKGELCKGDEFDYSASVEKKGKDRERLGISGVSENKEKVESKSERISEKEGVVVEKENEAFLSDKDERVTEKVSEKVIEKVIEKVTESEKSEELSISSTGVNKGSSNTSANSSNKPLYTQSTPNSDTPKAFNPILKKPSKSNQPQQNNLSSSISVAYNSSSQDKASWVRSQFGASGFDDLLSADGRVRMGKQEGVDENKDLECQSVDTLEDKGKAEKRSNIEDIKELGVFEEKGVGKEKRNSIDIESRNVLKRVGSESIKSNGENKGKDRFSEDIEIKESYAEDDIPPFAPIEAYFDETQLSQYNKQGYSASSTIQTKGNQKPSENNKGNNYASSIGNANYSTNSASNSTENRSVENLKELSWDDFEEIDGVDDMPFLDVFEDDSPLVELPEDVEVNENSNTKGIANKKSTEDKGLSFASFLSENKEIMKEWGNVESVVPIEIKREGNVEIDKNGVKEVENKKPIKEVYYKGKKLSDIADAFVREQAIKDNPLLEDREYVEEIFLSGINPFTGEYLDENNPFDF